MNAPSDNAPPSQPPAPTPPGDRRIPAFWSAGPRTLALVFALALAVRSVYVIQVRSIPFYTHPSVDARAFDEWAGRLAAGDWWGSEVFYQAPAYPYFLGVIYAVAGRHLDVVHIVQCVLGAASCVLLAAAGGRFFGRAAGLVAGACLALYPPAIFFDGIIQKSSLGLFLTTLLLWLLARAQKSPRTALFALSGAVLGLLALTFENALMFLPLLLLWTAIRFRAEGRRRWSWAGTILAGAALFLVPVSIRNALVGRTFAPTAANMGTNFYIGNNPEADGLYAPLLPGRSDPIYERHDAVALAEQTLGRTLTAGEVSRYWFGRGWSFVTGHPRAWLRLLARKWALVWNRFEIPDTEDLYAYGDWSALLRTLDLFLHFGILAPLATAGLVLAWPRRRDTWLLAMFIVAGAASIALFFVFARYRFMLVPLLALFAGFACAEGYARWRARRFGGLLVATLLAAATAAGVNRRMLPEAFCRSVSYANLGAICARDGQWDDAERYLRIALQLFPNSGPANQQLGKVRMAQGRTAEAELHFGLAAGGMNDLPGAVEHYRLALQADPDLLEAHYNLATVLAVLGRTDEAIVELQHGLELARRTGRPELIRRIGGRLQQLQGPAAGATPQPSP
jgi:4-amino-4-deoxy-L-arabinose transferase-like glycosyltransferase